jgi:hypothetical protein
VPVAEQSAPTTNFPGCRRGVPTPLLSEKKIRNFRAAVERLGLVICPSGGRAVESFLSDFPKNICSL